MNGISLQPLPDQTSNADLEEQGDGSTLIQVVIVLNNFGSI